MSLATQLARGTLALPMLLAFAGLGLVANQRAEAEPVGFTLGALVPAAHADGSDSVRQSADRAEQRLQRHREQQFLALERLGLAQARAAALPALGQQISRLCAARGTRNHVLVLAQAPADLGTLAVRFNTGCRA